MALETINIDIQTNAQKQASSLRDLRKEMNSLKGELLQLEAGTDEYNKVAQKLADNSLRLRDINEEMRYGAADLGERLATLNRLSTGLASGFSAIAATATLFGAESENLEKTMVKLQAAIAIVQGLQGLEGFARDLEIASIQFRSVINYVKTFITSLKTMKTALVATGIGALVVTIGLLIANWEKISKLWSDTSPQEKAAKAVSDLNDELDYLSTRSVIDATQTIKDYTTALKNAKGDIDLIKKATDEYNKSIQQQELYNAQIKLQQLRIAEEKTYLAYVQLSRNERLNSENEVVKAFINTKNERIKAEQDVAKIINKIELERQNKIAETIQKEKELSQERQKQYQSEINTIRDAYEALSKVLSDNELSDFEKQYADLQDNYNTNSQILQNALKTNVITQEQYNNEMFLLNKQLGTAISDLMDEESNKQALILSQNLDNQLNILNEKINKLRADSDKNIQNLDIDYSLGAESNRLNGNNFDLESYINYENQRLEITRNRINAENQLITQQLANEQLSAQQKLELNNLLLENQKYYEQEQIASSNRILNVKLQNNEREKLSTMQTVQLTLQSISSGLSGASNLISTLQSNIDTTTEEGFEKNKEYQKAQTWIQVASGITAAIASAMTIPPPFGQIIGGINAAFVLASGIAQIANINKQQYDSASAIAGGENSAPNVSGSLLSSSVYGQQLGMDNNIQLNNNQQNTRVYVVESDITNSQNAVKTQVAESTF